MKTILRVTLLVTFVAFANTLMATGNLKLNIQPISAEKALVAISSLTDTHMKITVADQLGRIVYYNEVAETTGDYKRVFDFSNLEAGQYTLSVESDKLTTEQPFEIRNFKIEVGAEKTTLEPFFGYNNGILKCSYLNFPMEKLTLNFYDQNELVYSKEIGNDFKVTEAFNLSKLAKGNYHAVLSTGDKSYSYPINLY